MNFNTLKDRAERICEREDLRIGAYLLCYVFRFLTTTMFIGLISDSVRSRIHLVILLIMCALAGVQLLMHCNRRQLILMALLSSLLLITAIGAGSIILIDIFLAIVLLRGIRVEKVARLTFWASVLLGTVTILSALAGFVENLTYYRVLNGVTRVRMSLGFVYPTDFAAHVFFTLLLFFYLKGGKLNWRNQLCYAAAAWFVSAVCNARLSTVMIVMIMVVSILYTRLVQEGKPAKAWLRWLLVLATPVCALINLMLVLCYDGSAFMEVLNKALSGRLSIGSRMLWAHGFKLFGQYIEQNGNGLTTESVASQGLEYTFLDMSYQRILMTYGLVLFVLLIGIVVWRSRRFVGKRVYLLPVIMLIVSFASIVEHHFLDFSYNVFFIYLLSEPELTVIEEGRVLPQRLYSRILRRGKQGSE